MASDGGSDFIKRNRPPRVQIAYEDPYDSEKMVELPFVMGVMADLSGNNPSVEKPSMEDREFVDVTKDNLDDYMQSVGPGLTMRVDNRLGAEEGQLSVNLQFNSMEDFNPAAIAKQVPALAKLLEARTQLANLQKYMSSKPKAQEHLRKLLDDPELMAALAARSDADAKDQ